MIEARPKSGYFVQARNTPSVLPTVTRPAQRPLDVSQWDQVLELVGDTRDDGMLILGGGTPDLSLKTLKPLAETLARLYRRNRMADNDYDALAGTLALRQQIARLTLNAGCPLHPDDITITTGCQEALSIAIRTVTSPGGVVAMDSPSFYGTMQILKANDLKALEIPTDPENGISLEALELALEQWPVQAILLTPTANNPLGYTMPQARRKALLALAQRFDVAVIEDDINGDLSYSAPRPRTIKSYDDDGRVLLCSSFSKSLTPSLRVGWLAPGRYRNQTLHMKYVSTGTTATMPQLAIADFIANGHYERHLRQALRQYRRNLDTLLGWVNPLFPPDTGVSYPQGGYLLWVELQGVDCMRLNRRLEASGIRIAPGPPFSASGKYRNCFRLNYAVTPNAKVKATLGTVAEAVAAMRREAGAEPA